MAKRATEKQRQEAAGSESPTRGSGVPGPWPLGHLVIRLGFFTERSTSDVDVDVDLG